MDVIKAESIPRKWQWVATALTEHEGTEHLVEIAENIDEIMKKVYGEHTHTSQHILDMRVWEKSSNLTTILDLATKDTNCTACSYTRGDRNSKDCKKCDFAIEGGDCTDYDSDPQPLFRQFTDGFVDYRTKVNKR